MTGAADRGREIEKADVSLAAIVSHRFLVTSDKREHRATRTGFLSNYMNIWLLLAIISSGNEDQKLLYIWQFWLFKYTVDMWNNYWDHWLHYC